MDFDFSRFDAASFAGVSERAVLNALPVQGSFIRQWMEYMYTVSDAPLAFHLGVGLGIVSGLVHPNVYLPGADELRANMFVMIVGPSSASRKTFSVGHATKQLQACGDAGRQFILGDDGSKEGFADEVIEFPRRIIVSEEGGNFLQHTIGGQYGAAIRTQLLGLYDCTPVVRHTIGSKNGAKAKNGSPAAKTPRQDNPRVSMLIACTKSHLEDYTFRADWEGGFLSRYAMIWARRERHFTDAKPHPEMQQEIRRHLQHLVNVVSVGPCSGMTQDAHAMWRAWQARLNSFAQTQDEKTSGVVDRSQQHARKAALVAAYDRHCAQSLHYGKHIEEPWAVEPVDVQLGCALGDFSIQSALHIEKNITDNEHGQIMNRIVNFLKKNDATQAASLPEVLRYLNRPIKQVTQYMDTLVAAEKIIRLASVKPNGQVVDVYAVPAGPWAASAKVVAATGALPPSPLNETPDRGEQH